MKAYIHSSSSGLAGLVAGGVLLLATLAACNRDQPPPAAAAPAPAPAPQVVTQPPVVVVPGPGPEVVPDDYVYYPEYEVYYSNTRHLYFFMDGGAWVWRSEPPPMVTIDVLHRGPSYHMDFHDSPAQHHAEISRRYPRGRDDRRDGQ